MCVTFLLFSHLTLCRLESQYIGYAPWRLHRYQRSDKVLALSFFARVPHTTVTTAGCGRHPDSEYLHPGRSCYSAPHLSVQHRTVRADHRALYAGKLRDKAEPQATLILLQQEPETVQLDRSSAAGRLRIAHLPCSSPQRGMKMPETSDRAPPDQLQTVHSAPRASLGTELAQPSSSSRPPSAVGRAGL